MSLALETIDLCYSYDNKRSALKNVSLQVPLHKSLAILGPNGGGKTTLFRLISTLSQLQEGQAFLAGLDICKKEDEVRRVLGVVFQSPSLDTKLTVEENLIHQGHLYGLSGKSLRNLISEFLEKFHLSERKKDIVQNLSGGLKRRVELIRALLHQPKVLILDEPTTGLDPSARREFWDLVQETQKEKGTSVIYTTHLFEEAERCDQLAILDSGELVAFGSPDELTSEIGGNILSIKSKNFHSLKEKIEKEMKLSCRVVHDSIRIETNNNSEVESIFQKYQNDLESVTLSKPTLEDVYILKTGKNFIAASN